jgi:hypothetical protein
VVAKERVQEVDILVRLGEYQKRRPGKIKRPINIF